MAERFAQHRGELDQLVQMFQADAGLERVGKDFTWPDDPGRVGVTEQRVFEYRRLCQSIGAPDCIEGYPEAKDPIWIHVSAHGMSFSGDSKGFLYSRAPPFEIVPSFDAVTTKRSETWLRPLEGPWYIYFDVRN